jgi:phospholipid/cholesterol/gamma-HCH transport system substrate-binding protein
MDERRLELKVGALALAAVALAGALLFALGGLRGGAGFVFHVDFAYAGGLPSGAVVKIAGVKVGRVKAVEFRPAARDEEGKALPVRLTLDVDRAAAGSLREDATATIGTQGALGETYLEVLPGSSPAPLAENGVLRGLDPPRLDVLFSKLTTVLESAASDDAFRSFLVEVARLAHTIDGLVGANRSDVKAFLKNVAVTLEEGRAAVQDVRVAAKGAASLLANPELKGLVSDLAATARDARTELPGVLRETHALIDGLGKTAGALTPDDVAKLKATLAKYDALATQLHKISANADAILTGVQKGEGTAGMLIKDPKVYEDLRALLNDLKSHPSKLVWGN